MSSWGIASETHMLMTLLMFLATPNKNTFSSVSSFDEKLDCSLISMWKVAVFY